MGRSNFTFTFTCISLLAAACGAGVDVGGPRADGGSAGSSSSGGKGGSVSTTPGGSQSMPSGGTTTTGGTTSMPTTPEMVASLPASCTTDADCCLVTDSCRNAAYVVGKGSREQVRALIDGRPKMCTGCIAPDVAVSCQNSQCVGVEVPYSAHPDPILGQDHCGAAPSNDAEMAMGGAPSGALPTEPDAGAPSASGGADSSDPSTKAAPPQTSFGCGVMR